MIIREVKERECCEQQDLKPVLTSRKFGREHELKFCIHCGARHHYQSFMDAAGSTDYHFVKIVEEQKS